MGRAFLTILFMAVLLLWLRFELKRTMPITKQWKWFAAALIVQALSGLVSFYTRDRVLGNLLYHAVGGGVTTTLLYIYLIKTYKLTNNWRIELALLFGFVSSLGVINELAEYAGEFALPTGLFSWDSHDTWRDLAANTTGAVIAWLVYRLACVMLQ